LSQQDTDTAPGAWADDPYADWWLVKVHDALDVADLAVQASLDAVQTQLTEIEAISMTPGASVRPVLTPPRVCRHCLRWA